MLRYIPLARARARLSLIEFLPPTTAPFTAATATMQAASLFLLASAPFAAADVVGDGTRKYASQGSCYDPKTHTVHISVLFTASSSERQCDEAGAGAAARPGVGARRNGGAPAPGRPRGPGPARRRCVAPARRERLSSRRDRRSAAAPFSGQSAARGSTRRRRGGGACGPSRYRCAAAVHWCRRPYFSYQLRSNAWASVELLLIHWLTRPA